MGEHLYPFVLSYVEGALLVDGTRLLRAEVVYLQRECLLVVLSQLRLLGVEYARDAGRKHIVYGLAVAVLLYVDSRHHKVAADGGRCVVCRCNGVHVGTPVASYQLQCRKAQCYRLLEVGEVHSHEAYRCEVAYGSYRLLVVGDGYAELVPVYALGLAVAQLGSHCTLVRYVVPSYLQVLSAQRDPVLEEVLVLVHGEVLVDILDVGGCLCR